MKLRSKFNREIAKASVMVLFIFLSLLIPWQSHKSRVINDKLIALMQSFISKDNPYFANAIFENREQSIRLRIEELIKIDGIQSAVVFDRSGAVISDSRPGQTFESDRLPFGQAAKKGWASWSDRSNLWYLQAIKPFEENMGYILIGYSLKDMKYRENLSLVFYTMVFIVLILIMLFLTSRLIRKIVLIPVNRLILSMSQIEKGQYGEQIQTFSNDEIGKLAKRFNAMSSEIDTSYKQVENQNQQLQKTKNLLDGIINSMPSLLITIDNKCKVKRLNAKACTESGFDASTAVGKDISEIFAFVDPLIPELKEALTGKISRKFPKIVASEGNQDHYYDLIVYPIRSEMIDDAVVIINDITTLVRMENIMVQTEKMMSVGGLAAGMAHEINNPLAGMIQNAQLIASRITQDLPANIKTAQSLGITMDIIRSYVEERQIVKNLDALRTSGLRAAQIVENMLSFSRKSSAKISKSRVDELLDSTITLSENDYNLKKKFDFRAIHIIREYSGNVPMVSCDENLIQQVFFNILKNGAEAMADEKHHKKKHTFWLRIKPMENWVQVEIEDNGPGMKEDLKKRIFEPFFTTKEVGVGTGLGLSVSYFIITENHNGKIWVESFPGTGTKFIIQLPFEHHKRQDPG